MTPELFLYQDALRRRVAVIFTLLLSLISALTYDVLLSAEYKDILNNNDKIKSHWRGQIEARVVLRPVDILKETWNYG